jgi:hypothetical protein
MNSRIIEDSQNMPQAKGIKIISSARDHITVSMPNYD